jgi:hypothetical protein
MSGSLYNAVRRKAVFTSSSIQCFRREQSRILTVAVFLFRSFLIEIPPRRFQHDNNNNNQ